MVNLTAYFVYMDFLLWIFAFLSLWNNFIHYWNALKD